MDRYDMLESKLSNALGMLAGILKEKLDNYGFYYRMFTRIKSGESIRRKLNSERYLKNPERKINDLFGVRITLYYQDDVEAVQRIVENMMVNVRWKETDNDASTFDAQKNNGTFLLPGFVQKIVEPEIEGLRIEPHFEIQIRTVLFEGWHEAEHDMRYKEMDLWEDFPKESRKLNSILATLEMCDQYMVTLLDDVGHDFYKSNNWGAMIKYKYRLKGLGGQLDERLERVMSADFAKQIFKWNKVDLMQIAMDRNIQQLDTNTIVYLVNERNKNTEDYSEEIRDEYFAIRRSNARREIFREKNILSLREEKAFDVEVLIDCSKRSQEEQFQEILRVVYEGWMRKELSHIFPEEFAMPVHPVRKKTQGINCKLKYDTNKYTMLMALNHAGLDTPGKSWKLSLEVKKAGKNLSLACKNYFLIPENAPTEILPFSRPKVYQYLGRAVTFSDVWPLTEKIEEIDGKDFDAFWKFITSEKRQFPVLLLTLPSDEEVIDSTSIYAQFVDYANNPKFPMLTNLMRKVGFVCHTYYVTKDTAEKLAKKMKEDASLYRNGIRFFRSGFAGEKDDTYQAYTEKEILEKPKDIYALRNKEPYLYQCVEGPDAMRHEVIQTVYGEILGIQRNGKGKQE